VFSLEDALALVALRGRLMQERPPGAMAAVALGEERLEAILPAGLAIASVNSAEQCVVSGPADEVAAFRGRLDEAGIQSVGLRTSHAFHSAMQDPVVAPLRSALERIERRPPAVRLASNLTGGWMTPAMAADPGYWGRQLREPVRFADCLRTLTREHGVLLVEVGPGTTLTGLARPQVAGAGARAVATMRRPEDSRSDRAALLEGLAGIWLAGAPVDWDAFGRPERRRLVSLPSYPFERHRYWIEAAPAGRDADPSEALPASHPRPADLPPVRRPEGPVEERVAAVFEELIGSRGIGSDDDFFALGGNSLIATRAAARLSEAFGVAVPLRVVFDRPTVAGLAAAVESLVLDDVEAAAEEDGDG
jgi:acyl transferase domain-containing protein